MGIYEYISRQFMNPKGFIGRIISNIQNRSNKQMYNSLVDLLKLNKEDILLDVGYGNGYLLELIYKKQPIDMYGIDISNDAKELAVNRNKAAATANQLHLDVGDCCHLPYSDNQFSAITTINTVYFWQDTLKGFQEIKRVLANGHSFYNVFYTKAYLDKIPFASTNYQKFEPEVLLQLGKDAGFTETKLVEIKAGESYIIVYTK